MAKLYVQNRKDAAPTLVADGDRGTIAQVTTRIMKDCVSRGFAVSGCLYTWQSIAKDGTVAGVAWIEPSNTALAAAPIPDFCRAPEGAPQ